MNDECESEQDVSGGRWRIQKAWRERVDIWPVYKML